MDDGSEAELEHRALEWTHGIVREWLDVNEAAQAIQANQPPEVRELLEKLPPGWSALGGAMAFSIQPDSVRVAHAVLVLAERQLSAMIERDLLSHPAVTLEVQGPSDEKTGRTGVAEQDEMAARVDQLERRVAELDELADEVSDLVAELRSLQAARRAG